jgi:ubiquinone/menaquinone biosynthesis C-methylase UbiE
MELDKIYRNRFSEKEKRSKNIIWQTLCSYYFQKFIKTSDTLLDLGAGSCEFINNIKSGIKIAVDPNKNVSKYADKSVRVYSCGCNNLDFIDDNSIDSVFISNLLEHLSSREEILKVLKASYRVLKSEGIILILQPNIRFAYREYWDFFDHKIPLSDRSLKEALEIADFQPVKIIPKFLPYTTKSVNHVPAPIISLLVRLYLYMPWLWFFFGKQAFIVAKKQ